MINLRCCLGVSKVSSTSKGHTVELYAKDYTLVMVAEDTGQQEDWYWAVKRLIEEEQRYEDDTEERGEGEDEGGERLDDEDDGYCTLTSGVFKEVVYVFFIRWQQTQSSIINPNLRLPNLIQIENISVCATLSFYIQPPPPFALCFTFGSSP